VPLLEALEPGASPRRDDSPSALSLPPGGAHWYIDTPGRSATRTPETFFESLASMSGWLDRLPDALEIPWDRIVLGGFSMGAVMSYSVGLGPGRPTPAGIMALSGFIPDRRGDSSWSWSGPGGLPVAIAHGGADEVIPVEFGRDARDRLEAAGADVLYRESPVPHTIDPAILPDLREWLAKAIPPGAAA